MTTNLRGFRGVLTAAVCAGLVLMSAAESFAQDRDDEGPRIYPPHSRPFGKSYGEWAAKWWESAYSFPVDNNPLFDETGSLAHLGDYGKVFFLYGIVNASGSATRTITVKSDQAIFFPVVNYEADNLFPPINTPTVKGLRKLSRAVMNTATDLHVEVDGHAVEDLAKYRFQSPVFFATMPANNIPNTFIPTPAGTYGPMVDDGYYLMLKPLSVGSHTIHFHASVNFNNPILFPPGPVAFTLDLVYKIKVVDAPDDEDDGDDEEGD